MAKKSKSTLWGDAPASPVALATNAAAPSELRMQRSVATHRFVVYTVFITLPIAVIVAIALLYNQATAPAQDQSVSSLSANDSQGKASAIATVSQWLASSPAPLPGAYFVSWDGFEPIAGGVKEASGQTPANAAEIHYFTLMIPETKNDDAIFYTATVLVSVDPILGAQVQGTPSLVQRVPDADTGWSSQVWAGHESGSTTDPIRTAASAWATAFTSTPAQLRLYVGDKDAANSYVPLAGAQVRSATVSDVGYVGYVRAEGDTSAPDTVIARVVLMVAWTTDPEDKGAPITYDVLIVDADTAAPRIVAWGGAGSGPSLVPFGNAVQSAVSGNAPALVTPTPTPTPTPTGAP